MRLYPIFSLLLLLPMASPAMQPPPLEKEIPAPTLLVQKRSLFICTALSKGVKKTLINNFCCQKFASRGELRRHLREVHNLAGTHMERYYREEMKPSTA